MPKTPERMTTWELCEAVAELAAAESAIGNRDALGDAARELAWRCRCALDHDEAGAQDPFAFLRAFPTPEPERV